MSKKIVSVALTASTVVWGLGLATLPLANAQSQSDLQAQIAALLAQIAQLQQQLGTPGSGSTTTSYTFTKNLTLGSRGPDVTALQRLLIQKGYLKVASPTAYFGALTKAALAKFQAANRISPASGYFGPITRAFVNVPPPPPPQPPPPLGIVTTVLPGGTVGASYSNSLTASGGVQPYSWSVATGSLPLGLTLGANGMISGTSTQVGQSNFTAQVADSSLPRRQTASRALQISVTAPTSTATSTPVTSMAISLSANNPARGSLISGTTGAARVPILAVNLTAGSGGAVNTTDIKFRKVGVLADSSIAGAYLTRSGQVIAQYNSISQGVISFSGLNLQTPAGTSQEIALAIDVAGGLAAGNTIGVSLASAADIDSFDARNTAVIETGAFPLNGNTFTVTTVSNPSLAVLTITSSSIGTLVTAGTQGNLVGAWNFSIQNSKTWLKGLNFRVIGSANKGDIRNVKLRVNGTQVGPTLASVAQDGTAYFDASATPGVLNTGSNNVQVFADVMGSPSFNFQFQILNGYEVLAVDSQYNSPIQAGSNAGTQITIQQGQITVTQDTSTPTGNIAKWQSQITLAKFAVYAAGEAVKVKFLDFYLNFVGLSTTTANLANHVRNVSLVDDAGGQVGSTINTPPSSNTCANSAGAPATVMTASVVGNVYADCFGTSGSPINYIVPANTTRVLSLNADIQTTAAFTTVLAALTGNSSNLQGLISSQTNSSGAANGAVRALATASLTVAQNNALGTQNVAKGVTNQRIGSYVFSASTAEGVNISLVNIQAGGVSYFQNLKVMVGAAQFGSPQPSVSSGSIYSFSGATPFTVPMGGNTIVDVYADILASASASSTPASTLSGCSGSGGISLAAITCSSVSGQNLTIAGQSTVTVTTDSGQAPIGQVVMGSTGNSLATFRFAETSNVENVKITNLNVIDQVAATSTVKPAFSNLTLWNGTTLVGTAGPSSPGVSGTAYLYAFNFGPPVVVPQLGAVSLTLKGDVASFTSGNATDNSVHTFKVATTTDASNNTPALTVIALGNTSNASSSVTLSSVSGNAMTVLRSKLTFAASPLGLTSSRSKVPADQLARLSFTADSAGPVVVNTVTVTFSGSAPSISTFLSGARLLDENNQALTAVTTSSACTGGSSTCSFTLSLGGTTSGQVITQGTTRNWTLVVDSTKTQTAAAQGVVNLVATINAIGDITYTDGLDSTATSGLTMPSSILTPINLNSVTFVQGT